MPQSIGQPLRRKEDLRLVTGGGRYSDDVSLPGQAYAYVLRSPHAHARIRGIDTAAARAMPGVLAVLTGADVVADGLKEVPHTPIPSKPPADILLNNRDGSAHGYAPQQILPTDRVRYVGQQVVMVVAESIAAAKDAAERVTVDYVPLEAVTETPGAVQTNVRLYDHTANVCIDADVGDVEATKAAFARAAHVAKFETWVQRVTGVPLDARAAVGLYDPATNKHTLHAGSGGVVRQKQELATILGVPPADVRVECGDVGGNYGTRNAFYPEFALVVWAAKRLGRPVKWTCERSEAFASDYQGRDQAITLELALDEKGKLPRGARLGDLQHRRAQRDVRAAGEVRRTAHLDLSGAGGAHPRARGSHQHAADQSLSQRRAARGDLRHRAGDRHRGKTIRLRPHRSPPPQHHPAEGAALHHAARHDLRLRRLRQDHGPGAGAVGLEGIQQAQARVQAQQEAPRHRACQLSRNHQRLAARMVKGRCEAGRALSKCRSAPCPAVRATRRASRNASANGSASMWRGSS